MHPMITRSSCYISSSSVTTKFIPLIFLLVFSLDGPRAKPFDNVGKSDFYQLIMHDGVFVDRSLFIDEYLRRFRAKILIVRPKLFGKSLNLDMLRRFLEIEVDANGQRIPKTERINRILFDGNSSQPLRIANSTATMQRQGEVPVVFISFKNLTGSTYREFESSVNKYITDLFANKYRYLRNNLTENDRDVFDMFAAGNATTPDLETCLRFLTKKVQKHFDNRKVHLLVDDYDAPFYDMMYETVIHRKPGNGDGEKVTKANDDLANGTINNNGTSENKTVAESDLAKRSAANNATSEKRTTTGNVPAKISATNNGTSEKITKDFLVETDFGQSVRLVAKMLANTLKNNPAVEQSLIMGRLPLSRTDMAVELERLVREYSSMNKPFSEFFGFFEGEVNYLASKLAPEANKKQLKRWYKGYQFADNVVYNPYSVMRSLQHGGRCDDYWAQTNDTKLVDHLFRNQDLFDEVCELLGNETVEFQNTKFSFVDIVRGDLFRYLLFTGYVSPLWRGVKKKPIGLKIPNYEIRRSYREKVINWATNKYSLTESERQNATNILGDDINTSQLRFWLRSRLHR